jgi:hypothetical protein
MRLAIRRIFARQGLLLIDRSLTDFLIVNRKSHRPRWVWGVGLARFLGARIPCIQLVVSHQTLAARKQEMTSLGHSAWDRMMHAQLTGRVPTDVLCFFNGRTQEESLPALMRIIETTWGIEQQAPDHQRRAAEKLRWRASQSRRVA